MITGIDHIALAVQDLDGAVAAYRRFFGREAQWSGRGGGARHAWFQLDDMALDLIAPEGPGPFGEVIRRHLDRHGESVWALAFRADDIAEAHRLVERRGLRAAPPGPVSSTRDDGRKRHWMTSTLDPEDTAGVQLLLIAPPEAGQAWAASPVISGVTGPILGLDHVVIRTVAPDRALAIYGARLGLDLRLDRAQTQLGVRQLFFRCGPAVVEFAAPLQPVPLQAGALQAGAQDGPDHVAGLAWRVDDADAAQARLSELRLDVSHTRPGRKPGSRVFTLRAGVAAAPSLVIQQGRSPPAERPASPASATNQGL